MVFSGSGVTASAETTASLLVLVSIVPELLAVLDSLTAADAVSAELPQATKDAAMAAATATAISFLILLTSYRCSTRSLISAVRPWFQNWVPI